MTGADPHLSGRAVERSRAVTIAVFVLSVIFFGFNWPIIKVALSYVEPLWFGFARIALGALALFAINLARGPLRLPDRRDLPAVLVFGILQVGFFIALIHYGVRYIGAGRAAVLAYTTPIWVIPLAALFLPDPISRFKWVGAALGIAGIGLLFNPLALDYTAPGMIAGYAMLLLAAILSSIAIVYLRGHRWVAQTLDLAPWQLLLGAIILFVLALAIEGPPRMEINQTSILAVGYNAFIASAFCMWGFALASRELPSATVSLGSLGTPVLGVASSGWLMGEVFDLSTLAGLGLIVLGVVLGTAADAIWAKRKT